MQRQVQLLERKATWFGYQEARRAREREEMNERKQLMARVSQWLAPLSQTARHESFRDARLAGTGQWLIDRPEFRGWLDPEQCVEPLLWLHGIPGAGKWCYV